MSDVRLEKQIFDLADLGKENPLPDFRNVSYVHSSLAWDESLTEEDTRYMQYGRVSSIIPYFVQDGYTRSRKKTERDVVVLENPFVRAEFLPWMGGRLRSLRCGGREMLHVNPVIQPCNLALRNAWCSGGVEWNVGIRGHCMFTNDPLFTETLRLPDGTCGVRFYEYERIRGVVYRVEAYLPPDSRFLYVHPRIENPQGNGAVPMYWWSNIAVPETPGTRVIAPADTGILTRYDQGQYRILRAALPDYEGMDLSRPGSIGRSLDVFYDIREGCVPFITALQSDHTGLVQCSAGRLRGRKLFVWGMGQGGRHWQKFLSDGSENYIEIQAGIAKTQHDHIPMPENASWDWLEAYGPLTCDIDGLSYRQAAEKCAGVLEKLQSGETLEREFSTRARRISEASGDPALAGSGWGALENLRRGKMHLPPLSKECRFPEASLAEPQKPWLDLLETGGYPPADPLSPPESYITGDHWLKLLERAPENGASALQLAVARYAAGDTEGARQSLLSCLSREENPFALRALARMALSENDTENALARYRQALALIPRFMPLCLEYAQALLAAGREKELLLYLDTLDESMAGLPRFLYLRAAADVSLGRYDEAEKILRYPLVIPDMREGELSLSEIWFRLFMNKHGISRAEAEKRFPLPEALDFRMH